MKGGRGTLVGGEEISRSKTGCAARFDVRWFVGFRFIEVLPRAQHARVAVKARVIRFEPFAVLRVVAVVTGGICVFCVMCVVGRVADGAVAGTGCIVDDRVERSAYNATRDKGHEQQDSRSLAHRYEHGSSHFG